MKWFSGLKLVWQLVILVVFGILAFIAWNFVDDLFSKSDETKASISQNQTDAAIASGKDTTNTVTHQYTKEIERNNTVQIIKEKVNEAPDVHAAHAAGADGLCNNFGICGEERVQRPTP